METMQLFNPGNQSEKQIRENFSIRLKEFKSILKIIQDDQMDYPPQHFIILGVRGSGKTTLLLRVYYELKSDKKINTWLIPVIFNEEQYSVNKLFKLWEKIASELEHESENYDGLLGLMQAKDEIDGYEEHCYEMLFEALKKHKNKICIFIDNIGDILQKLTKKEQQRLREVLITNNSIRIIGGTAIALESTYKYDEPFYEYFKIIHLNELKSKETREFLLELDKINGSKKIQEIIDNNPGRIEALRIITGGVPRTIVLLYEIFINDSNGDSFKYLEVLLDRATPLYKHRMDDLSSQQQEIIDCIALNWDAIAVKEIARITRMESKAVSSQLRLLEKNNIVIKKATSTKNHLYQVKERFFNIWYMMRNGRKSDKNKVKWLTKFLELWCGRDSLDEMIDKHLLKLKSEKVYDKYAYSLSEAYAQMTPSPEKQYHLLSSTKEYLESQKSDLVNELSKSDFEYLLGSIDSQLKDGQYEKAFDLLNKKVLNTNLKDVFKAFMYHIFFNDIDKSIEYYLLAIKKGSTLAMRYLANIYHSDIKDYNNAKKYYLMAIDKNDKKAMNNLALLYDIELNDFKNAEKYYLMAINKNDKEAMENLAFLYLQQNKNKKKAEELSTKALETGNNPIEQKISHATILLWNNKFNNALDFSTQILEDDEIIKNYTENIELLINLLIAKEQYNFVYKIFEENKHQIKDRLKPIYYALMHFMQDKYPDEIKKMGDELKETVESIIKVILELREKYK